MVTRHVGNNQRIHTVTNMLLKLYPIVNMRHRLFGVHSGRQV